MARSGVNWARGFLRLWSVLSVIWIVGMSIMLRPDQSVQSYRQYQEIVSNTESAPANPFSRFADEEQRRALELVRERLIETARERVLIEQNEILISFVVILVPSLVLLLLGVGFYWAAIGFRREEL